MPEIKYHGEMTLETFDYAVGQLLKDMYSAGARRDSLDQVEQHSLWDVYHNQYYTYRLALLTLGVDIEGSKL